MQYPHQSEPVNSTSIDLFSALAFPCAAAKSVSHGAAETADAVMRTPRNVRTCFIKISFCRPHLELNIFQLRLRRGKSADARQLASNKAGFRKWRRRWHRNHFFQ